MSRELSLFHPRYITTTVYCRINFKSWMTTMEPKASPTMAPTIPMDRGATANSGSSAGTSSTSPSSRAPMVKAPNRARLFQKCR